MSTENKKRDISLHRKSYTLNTVSGGNSKRKRNNNQTVCERGWSKLQVLSFVTALSAVILSRDILIVRARAAIPYTVEYWAWCDAGRQQGKTKRRDREIRSAQRREPRESGRLQLSRYFLSALFRNLALPTTISATFT